MTLTSTARRAVDARPHHPEPPLIEQRVRCRPQRVIAERGCLLQQDWAQVDPSQRCSRWRRNRQPCQGSNSGKPVDGSKYHIVVHSDEADVSFSADDEVSFIIFFGQHQKIMVRWLKGTLADWLEFIFGLKENLGLQASKDRELQFIRKEMEAK